MKHATLFAALLLAGCYKEPTIECPPGSAASVTFYSFATQDIPLMLDGFPPDTLQPGEAHKYILPVGTYTYCTGHGEGPAIGSFEIRFPCETLAIRIE